MNDDIALVLIDKHSWFEKSGNFKTVVPTVLSTGTYTLVYNFRSIQMYLIIIGVHKTVILPN
jgi:hypothetical protein